MDEKSANQNILANLNKEQINKITNLNKKELDKVAEKMSRPEFKTELEESLAVAYSKALVSSISKLID